MAPTALPTSADPEGIVSQLNSCQAGLAFMRELNAYLDEYGCALTHPAWREDPRIVINAIQGYLAIEDGHGPDTQLQSAIRRREELLADARAREPSTERSSEALAGPIVASEGPRGSLGRQSRVHGRVGFRGRS